MEVIEDFESRPHNLGTLLVEGDKEIQDWRELNMQKALPGFSGGKLLGGSRAEGGREEEEDAVRKVENVTNVILAKEQRDEGCRG